MSETPNQRHVESDYAVVFSGGGALGSWEIGCFKEVLRFHQGKPPSIVTGASAGALNAAGYHLGLTPDDLRAIWEGLTKQDVFKEAVNLKALAAKIGGSRVNSILMSYLGREDEGLFTTIHDAFAGKESIFDTAPLEQTIDRIFADSKRAEAFSRADNTLVMSTTRLADGKPELLYHLKNNKRNLPDAARKGRYTEAWKQISGLEMLKQGLIGTAALPILFPPMEGRFDGGVLLNQPIAPAVMLGARLIYVFIPSADAFGRTTHFFELTQTLLTTWLTSSLEAQIRQIGANNKIYRELLGRRGNLSPEAVEKLESRTVRLCVMRPQQDLGVGLLDFGKDVGKLIVDGGQRASHKLANEFDFDDHETWDGYMDQDGRVL